MSLDILSFASLLNKEGTSKSTKSKGRLEGSIPQPVGGWVCYSLVSELLVETSSRCGSGLLVRVSWLRSNSNLEVEKIGRNGVAESMQELERQISFVMDRRIVTVSFKFRSDHHCGIKRDPGSLDQRVGEQGSFVEGEEEG
jgi:hypothetical protein